jgi:hypothetical protein
MPTARDHYRKAEHLSDTVLNGELLHTPDMRQRLATLAVAHATLALAATNGANRTPLDRIVTAELAQGEEITDQMGDQPDPEPCTAAECVCSRHDTTSPHVDAEGREFR